MYENSSGITQPDYDSRMARENAKKIKSESKEQRKYQKKLARLLGKLAKKCSKSTGDSMPVSLKGVLPAILPTEGLDYLSSKAFDTYQKQLFQKCIKTITHYSVFMWWISSHQANRYQFLVLDRLSTDLASGQEPSLQEFDDFAKETFWKIVGREPREATTKELESLMSSSDEEIIALSEPEHEIMAFLQGELVPSAAMIVTLFIGYFGLDQHLSSLPDEVAEPNTNAEIKTIYENIKYWILTGGLAELIVLIGTYKQSRAVKLLSLGLSATLVTGLWWLMSLPGLRRELDRVPETIMVQQNYDVWRLLYFAFAFACFGARMVIDYKNFSNRQAEFQKNLRSALDSKKALIQDGYIEFVKKQNLNSGFNLINP